MRGNRTEDEFSAVHLAPKRSRRSRISGVDVKLVQTVVAIVMLAFALVLFGLLVRWLY